MRNLPVTILYSDKPVLRISRHAFLFIATVLIFTMLVFFQSENDTFFEVLKSVLLNALFFFGYAYFTAFYLVPYLLIRNRYWMFSILFLFTGAILSVFKFLCSDYIFYGAISSDFATRIETIRFSYLLVNTKDMTFVVALFLIAKYAKDNYQMKRRLHELQDARLSTELRHLKNQLDPHVVFNNLNNLYALSINEKEAFLPYITRFKNLLNYYFKKAKSKRVLLAKELAVIDDYLELEQLRYGDRLKITRLVEGDLRKKWIIPFVLFNFVENCFQHGCSEDSGDAWVKLGVKAEENSVTFHASNSKPGNTSTLEKRARVAELATRRKLEMLYPGKYMLRIDDRENMYCLDIKLKI